MDGVAQPPAIMPLSLESDAQQQKQQQVSILFLYCIRVEKISCRAL
jgi:hypothetical protein